MYVTGFGIQIIPSVSTKNFYHFYVNSVRHEPASCDNVREIMHGRIAIEPVLIRPSLQPIWAAGFLHPIVAALEAEHANPELRGVSQTIRMLPPAIGM